MSIKVVRGSVTTNSLNYSLGGGTAFATGDLIRITANGEIELADAAAAGAVHGIALKPSTDYADGEKGVPIALFDKDTVLAVPCEAGNAPDDYTVGIAYGIIVTTKAQTMDLSNTTNGIMLVVGKQGDDQAFNPDVDDAVTTGDGTYIYCSITQANLDGRIAAST
jgi:hypothetical protein